MEEHVESTTRTMQTSFGDYAWKDTQKRGLSRNICDQLISPYDTESESTV